MTEIALFAGAGGGVLASRMLGLRTVAYVEWDAFPQSILKARMAEGFIDHAPVFGDVREFNTAPYADRVDIVSGGFPCQPFSTAGRQDADSDPRNMWPATRDIIRNVRPKYAYLENVAGLLTGSHGYFGVVLGELSRSGYDIVWTCLPAAAVGAPHRRDRMWILGRRRDIAPMPPPDGVLLEFARFDESTLSWKSASAGQCRGDSASNISISVNWPRAGYVSGGHKVYVVDPVAQPDGSTRGGWPWPNILADRNIPDTHKHTAFDAPLAPGIERMPTPNAFDAHTIGSHRAASRPEWGRHGISLHHLVSDWQWPTPMTQRNRKSKRAMLSSERHPGGQSSPPGLEQMAEIVSGIVPIELQGAATGTLPVATQQMVGNLDSEMVSKPGQLNPDWVEWLMGWPIGWTSTQPLSPERFQQYIGGMPGDWWVSEPHATPRLCEDAPDRASRLKAIGNGQVPLCNAAAFTILLETYRQIEVAIVTPNTEMDAFELLGL